MPVVGRGDHHRVDILAGQHLTEIPGRKAILVLVVPVYHPLGPLHVTVVHIANRHHPGVLVIEEGRQVPARAVIAGTDESDGDSIARGRLAIGPACRGWNESWYSERCCSGGRLPQKSAAGMRVSGHDVSSVHVFF